MFTVEFDRLNSLLLVRFRGQLALSDISTFDKLASAFVAAEGPVHIIVDFTAVQSISIPDRAIAERGRQPQLCPSHRRAIVAPQAELRGLYQVFAANQEAVGLSPPPIVETLGQALVSIGLRKSRLKTVTVSTPELSGLVTSLERSPRHSAVASWRV